MSKKRAILNYRKISDEIKLEIDKQYPFGVENHLVEMTDHKGEKHKAIMVEMEEFIYLIKLSFKDLRRIMSGIKDAEVRKDLPDDLSDYSDFSEIALD